MKTVLAAGSEYHRIDVVVDSYRDETIKGTTRTRCSKAAPTIRRLVEGRDVPLPKHWSNVLSLADNKADLTHFLAHLVHLEWPFPYLLGVGIVLHIHSVRPRATS